MVKTFLIEGMHCDNCAHAVKEAISAIPGVEKVDVDLAGKCAAVTYDGKAADKDIMNAIEDIGFDAAGVK